MLAQSLKKQNQQLKTQNTILTDSIQKLNTSLDSVAQLKTKLTADYEKLKAQYGKSESVDFERLQAMRKNIFCVAIRSTTLQTRCVLEFLRKSRLQNDF